LPSHFAPRPDVLAAPQRRLWNEHVAVPKEFVLYDGTALALQLGHRRSLDFDFFGERPFDLMVAVAAAASAFWSSISTSLASWTN